MLDEFSLRIVVAKFLVPRQIHYHFDSYGYSTICIASTDFSNNNAHFVAHRQRISRQRRN